MYKDKDRQREANRQAQARFKAKKVLPEQGITIKGITQIPKEQMCITDDWQAGQDGSIDIETLSEMDAGCGDKLSHGLKRGKDIKTFDDLPPDVQQTIRTISESNEEFKRRTSIAIAYQHTFPGRY